MNAIELIKLRKEYKDTIAVNDLSLEIKEGELFALLGVNGAGKTTTIKMLSCLSSPTSGDALIFNKSIIKDKMAVKKIINISPQETAIAPNLTVKENLELIAGIYEIPINEINDMVKQVIKLFDLEKVKLQKAKTLSGGWQRKVSIALAIITRPKVLFLDEPTLGLDVIARRELWAVIKELKKSTTIILTTHYMEEAEMLSDRIGIMKNGSLLKVGTAKEIIKETKALNFEDAFVKIVMDGE